MKGRLTLQVPELQPKKQPPALGQVLREKPAEGSSSVGPRLCLDNARGDEEDQLLVRGRNRTMLEQVAEVRHVAQ